MVLKRECRHIDYTQCELTYGAIWAQVLSYHTVILLWHVCVAVCIVLSSFAMIYYRRLDFLSQLIKCECDNSIRMSPVAGKIPNIAVGGHGIFSYTQCKSSSMCFPYIVPFVFMSFHYRINHSNSMYLTSLDLSIDHELNAICVRSLVPCSLVKFPTMQLGAT